MFEEEKIIPGTEQEVVEEEVEVEEVDVEEEEVEEEEELQEEVTVKKDKKTAAIIREKQANKALRDKVALLEQEKLQRERELRETKYKQQLADKGFSPEEVEEKVSERRKSELLEREVKQLKYERQADKLAEKYPGVYESLDTLIDLVESSGGKLTLAEACKAKLDISTPNEIKTKAEQNVLLNQKKAKAKQIVGGEVKGTPSVKFDAEDEEAYKFYASKNPGVTRQRYAEILKMRRA